MDNTCQSSWYAITLHLSGVNISKENFNCNCCIYFKEIYTEKHMRCFRLNGLCLQRIYESSQIFEVWSYANIHLVNNKNILTPFERQRATGKVFFERPSLKKQNYVLEPAHPQTIHFGAPFWLISWIIFNGRIVQSTKRYLMWKFQRRVPG